MNLNLSVNKLVAVICFPPHLLLLKCPPNFVRTLTNALPGSLREGSVFQAFLKILLTAGEYLTQEIKLETSTQLNIGILSTTFSKLHKAQLCPYLNQSVC
jgi:hypothetical protein